MILQIIDQESEKKQKMLADDPYDNDLKNQMFVEESKFTDYVPFKKKIRYKNRPKFTLHWKRLLSLEIIKNTMYALSQHVSFVKGQTVGAVSNSKQDVQTLIEIPITATIEEVFDVLLAENILSIPPIFDNVNGNNNDERNDYREINLDGKSSFLQKPIGELIGLTPESTHLTICHHEDSLADLLDLFTRRQIHRVLVADKTSIEDTDVEQTINEDISQPCFISQTDVVRFLFQNNHRLGKILDTMAADVVGKAIRVNESLPFERRNLLRQPSSVTIHDQALTAFRKIHQDEVSAVAVVNDDGTLVSEVSAADLRGLNRERLSDLKKPVIMFLVSCKGALIKPFTCHGKFTLSQVMAGILTSKTHRAWVVDEDDVPIGVITLSDILAMFLPESA
ncbi:11456_t:CDS:2 [Racocetra fulgida]|uniref:11456_t:CDS:1 n=1 Tax=Racocetra fulgida TaxID=60492 RepID=A0A9N8W9Y7_9GLOM|nr:11456_t:CDS:2 [Racocetra fulgida]